MSKDESKPGDAFFDLYGMKVRVTDLIPDGATFGIQPDKSGPIKWFGYDEGAPEGDYSVVQINPSFRIDKGLLDDLSADALRAADYFGIEMRAMRLAADIEASRQSTIHGTATGRQPGETPSFRMDDMIRIMKQMQRTTHDHNVKLIENLMAAGFTVTCNDVSERPVAVLPESYRDALREVTSDRDNRDPAENFYRGWGMWPERFTADHFNDLKAGMSPAEFRKHYMGEFSSEEGDNDDRD